MATPKKKLKARRKHLGKVSTMRKVLVVHTHERGEGSTPVFVYPDTPSGRARANAMSVKLTQNDVDVASVSPATLAED